MSVFIVMLGKRKRKKKEREKVRNKCLERVNVEKTLKWIRQTKIWQAMF